MRISDWSSDVCSSDLHIEGIGGVAPVCCGIGQGTDYLLHVPECPGPTMGKDQRDRLRPLTRLPDEMNGKPVNCDAVMGELVDRPLGLTPIEFALPCPRQLAKIAAIEAIAPAHVLHFGGPASGGYPRPHVLKDLIADVNGELLRGHRSSV